MRRSLMAAISAGVLVVGVGAGVGVASADPSPECPRGSVGVGVACHETDPGRDNWTYDPASGSYRRAPAPPAYQPGDDSDRYGTPRTQHERLVLIRACIDLRVGRLAGLDTGYDGLGGRDEAVAVELECQRRVPPCPPQPCCQPGTPPAGFVPSSPPAEVPAPPAEGSAPPVFAPAPLPSSPADVGQAPPPEIVGATLPVTH
jgi:hypothetical protein